MSAFLSITLIDIKTHGTAINALHSLSCLPPTYKSPLSLFSIFKQRSLEKHYAVTIKKNKNTKQSAASQCVTNNSVCECPIVKVSFCVPNTHGPWPEGHSNNISALPHNYLFPSPLTWNPELASTSLYPNRMQISNRGYAQQIDENFPGLMYSINDFLLRLNNYINCRVQTVKTPFCMSTRRVSPAIPNAERL